MTLPFPSTPSLLDVDRRRPRSLVSLTPLIDVVFILLVFFMLASSFLDWRAIDVAAPAAGNAVPAAEGALLVEVRADGRVRVGGEPIDLQALHARVAERVAARREQRILVKPQQGVPLQSAIDVLDRLTAAGATDVALIRDSSL